MQAACRDELCTFAFLAASCLGESATSINKGPQSKPSNLRVCEDLQGLDLGTHERHSPPFPAEIKLLQAYDDQLR